MKTKLLLGLRVVLAIYFALNGALKLAAHPHMVESFAGWGYPTWFLYLVGVVELAAALALPGSRSVVYAVVVLEGVMIGALGTHLLHAEWAHALIPAVVMLLLALASGRQSLRARR